MKRTIQDSTGIQVVAEACDLPEFLRHAQRVREHEPEACYRLSCEGFDFGYTFRYRAIGRGLRWRGFADRTNRQLGDYKTEEAAIHATIIEALRHNTNFRILPSAQRVSLLLPSIPMQRQRVNADLAQALGGGAAGRKLAEIIYSNKDAIEDWLDDHNQIDERLYIERTAPGKLPQDRIAKKDKP